MKEYCWYPSRFLSGEFSLFSKKYAVIILNQPLCLKYNKFLTLWKKATIKICADGGANHLYRLYKNDANIVPDYIIGDMDSLIDPALKAYTSKGIKIIQDPDQNSTDFGKSINFVRSTDISITDIIALNTFSGRVDQTLESIHQAYLASFFNPPISLYLFSIYNITFLLFKGINKIHMDLSILGSHCGLVPVGKKCTVTTEGMKWDLKNKVMEYGRIVSTNNIILKNIITVETNENVLFTVEIRSFN
ncbi:hypothetical protein PORY_002650 [Pneumocystis oryctolagi]|uniref:Uncharacterized protein n=1 Tax=Pneumocystis oryctolagi TaxID=42067 RepID=A0ACB7CAC3_9ASCO|nr:hypothetical protein PORY_002650 [Pneumocystis oryctolagi]